MKTPKTIGFITLHWVNGWLKYTGFRLFVGWPDEPFDAANSETWVRLGIQFHGWADLG